MFTMLDVLWNYMDNFLYGWTAEPFENLLLLALATPIGRLISSSEAYNLTNQER